MLWKYQTISITLLFYSNEYYINLLFDILCFSFTLHPAHGRVYRGNATLFRFSEMLRDDRRNLTLRFVFLPRQSNENKSFLQVGIESTTFTFSHMTAPRRPLL